MNGVGDVFRGALQAAKQRQVCPRCGPTTCVIRLPGKEGGTIERTVPCMCPCEQARLKPPEVQRVDGMVVLSAPEYSLDEDWSQNDD